MLVRVMKDNFGVSYGRGVMNFSFLISADVRNKKKTINCVFLLRQRATDEPSVAQTASEHKRCDTGGVAGAIGQRVRLEGRFKVTRGPRRANSPRLHLILTFPRRRSAELTVTVKKRREPCGTSGRPQSRGEQEGQRSAAKDHGNVQRCA